jgi:hypothetical protein
MQDFINSFQRNPDGSWTCIAAATLNGPNGRIQVPAGKTIERGTLFMGVDLAEWLDNHSGGHGPVRDHSGTRPYMPAND